MWQKSKVYPNKYVMIWQHIYTLLL